MPETMTASRVMVSVIPIVGIVMGSVVIFFYLLWSHREKKLLIERGLFNERPLDWAMFSLLVGILLTTLGAVLSLVFFLVAGLGLTLLGGLIPLSLGVGFLIFFAVWARRRPEA